jgi:hypothetical protein
MRIMLLFFRKIPTYKKTNESETVVTPQKKILWIDYIHICLELLHSLFSHLATLQTLAVVTFARDSHFMLTVTSQRGLKGNTTVDRQEKPQPPSVPQFMGLQAASVQ